MFPGFRYSLKDVFDVILDDEDEELDVD